MTLGKILALVYAAGGYLLGLLSIACIVGFLADVAVPKSVRTGPTIGGWPAIGADLGLVWLFGLHHSVTARRWFKARWTRVIPPRLERSTYLYMTAAATAALVWFWQPVPVPVWSVENPVAAGAIRLGFLAVLALMFSATFPIGHMQFFGVAQAWADLRGRAAWQPEFSRRWLYALLRHPISLGWILVPWITPQMTVGQLVFAFGTAVYVLAATVFEEADLVAEMGGTYRRYQREVPAFLPRFRLSGRRNGPETGQDRGLRGSRS